MGIAARWREYSRQYGLAGLLRHLVAKALRPAWEHAAIHILVAEPPAPSLVARAPIQIGPMSADQAKTAGFLHPDWQERWQRGDVCFGAWLNGVCIHHSWVTTGRSFIGEAHGWLKPGQNEAYIYDCFTSGASRGLGVFPAVLSHIEQTLFNDEVKRLWIAVETENLASRKAIERAGFVRAGILLYRRIGLSPAWQVTRATAVTPFEFEREGRP